MMKILCPFRRDVLPSLRYEYTHCVSLSATADLLTPNTRKYTSISTEYKKIELCAPRSDTTMSYSVGWNFGDAVVRLLATQPGNHTGSLLEWRRVVILPSNGVLIMDIDMNDARDVPSPKEQLQPIIQSPDQSDAPAAGHTMQSAAATCIAPVHEHPSVFIGNHRSSPPILYLLAGAMAGAAAGRLISILFRLGCGKLKNMSPDTTTPALHPYGEGAPPTFSVPQFSTPTLDAVCSPMVSWSAVSPSTTMPGAGGPRWTRDARGRLLRGTPEPRGAVTSPTAPVAQCCPPIGSIGSQVTEE